MSIRSALVLLLCLSLAMPAGMPMAASSVVDAVVVDAPAQAEMGKAMESDCHHRAATQANAGSDTDASRQPDGDVPEMPCCTDCDCGCLPTTTLPVSVVVAASHTPTAAMLTRTQHISAARGDTLLRPPIG